MSGRTIKHCDWQQKVISAVQAYKHCKNTLYETNSANFVAKANLDDYKSGYYVAVKVSNLKGQNTALKKSTQNAEQIKMNGMKGVAEKNTAKNVQHSR